VAFPEMRKGGVGLCVGTLLAPCWRPENPIGGWRSAEQGWAQVKGQLSWYQAMEECGELEMVTGVKGLDRGGKDAIGMVLSLEGADPVLSMRHLEALYEAGLRAVGPAHYGAGIYANGTDGAGGLNECGRELLREMEQLGIILDVTHLCDDSFWEAVEVFDGPVWASHSNCRELVDHNRQFSDEQLKYLIGRGAVIGSAMDAWMLVPGWERGVTTPEAAGAGLEQVVENIDHVCQLAGSALHSGIGSDLDGGFGTEQSPYDLDTIADLGKVGELLKARGYSDAAVAMVMSGNFVRALSYAWGG
ncbi:MAG: membrane dipeptidase, partial [Verrucomicrobiales bacterium]|nr:membrane dipeptidase [Verrucomicrobiales bacterium]